MMLWCVYIYTCIDLYVDFGSSSAACDGCPSLLPPRSHVLQPLHDLRALSQGSLEISDLGFRGSQGFEFRTGLFAVSAVLKLLVWILQIQARVVSVFKE